ncbi:MAG: exodeoxyribonuclease III [bacterium]
MKIASWNVNSVRARLDRVLGWLDQERPDVLCLQETKVVDADFPEEPFRGAGYHALVHGQKTYNGVAILSRAPVVELARGFDDGHDDLGARFLAAQVEGVLVASVYVPNGREVDSTHFHDKLAWLGRLRAFLERRSAPAAEVVLCGDWNVAPDDRDVYDPEGWVGRLHCHPDERAALRELCAWGLTDTYRLHESGGGKYSWWDYRQLAFPRNHGLRIDLILASRPVADRCVRAAIDRDARKGKGASDHTVIWAELDR